MGDVCLVSKDGPSSDNRCRDPTNLARRSMSIFSRKGDESPEPVSFTPLEAIQILRDKQMSETQRSWLSHRRRSGEKSASPKHGRFKSSRGTVLHAVPPASVIRLSALEEEMARSPNQEILSAISECAPALRAVASPSHSLSSAQQESPSRHSPLESTGRGGSSSRIGVWVDGVVHWEEDQTRKTNLSMTESYPACPTASGMGQKPCLSVIIPNNKTRSRACTIYQPQQHRPLSPTIPARCSVPPTLDRPTAPLRVHSRASRVSRSSTSSCSISEDASICSKWSSATSIEMPVKAEWKDSYLLHGRSPAAPQYACSVQSTGTAHFNLEATSLPWIPPIPARTAPCPPANDRTAQTTVRLVSSDELCHPRDVKRSSSNADLASPTLSQAEHDLQCALATNPGDHANSALGMANVSHTVGSIRRGDSVREVMQPPSRAPTIPKRSRKRDWRTRIAHPALELQRRQSDIQQRATNLQDADAPRKSASVSCRAKPVTTTATNSVPQPPQRSTRRPISNMYATNIKSASAAAVAHRRDAISAAMMPTVAAEDVLPCILARLHSLKDLFNTAIMNKGMYRVYKENEIHLLRTVVHNESPAMWELLEWSPPDADNVNPGEMFTPLEHSPLSYISCYRDDVVVIERLKRLILERCQSFLRRETVFALSTPTHPNAPRFNDAFWRIWSFCRIFGSVKNREDDIIGQMDWLKGGVLANNEDCIASTEPTIDFDMMSVLISPPSCFAEGNKGGLSASQLVDMTEIWTCMTVLLQDYHGRVGQARYYGVFDQCDFRTGDIEGEEATLEEWTAYLMTLGPKVVLEMAQLNPAAGFALAKDNGWTRWTPPVFRGSRASFLKEPVAKSYEEQIVVAKQRLQNPHEQSRKDASRRRVAALAAEIRLRRQSSAFKRSPLIDMTTERAMSISSRRDSVSPTRTTYSRGASRRASASPAISVPSSFHPIVEDLVARAKDTSERAIQQLVTMGFEREMAIDALRITDTGDCLRPDRAIDLLLRQQE